MKYKVVRYFTDMQDNNYAYSEGDFCPREGLVVSEARIGDLLSGNNFQKIALIKKVLESEEDVVEDKNPEVTLELVKKTTNYIRLKALARKIGVNPDDFKDVVSLKEELYRVLGE